MGLQGKRTLEEGWAELGIGTAWLVSSWDYGRMFLKDCDEGPNEEMLIGQVQLGTYNIYGEVVEKEKRKWETMRPRYISLEEGID
jgi:hypothetical protein